MFTKIWIVLFLAFGLYTFLVYKNCDSDDHNKPGDEVIAGWETWQENNCQSCHQLYGLGGYMGPDLTNTASSKGADYMKVFIKYGSDRMPNFHLPDSEVANLVAFLSWVDKTGQSRVPPESVHWTGNYIINKQ